MRRWIAIATVVLAGAGIGACLDEEALLGLDCQVEADCAPSQNCVTTTLQRATDMGFGQCVAGNSCTPGEQLGCECKSNLGAANPAPSCTSFAAKPECSNPDFDSAQPISPSNNPFLDGMALTDCRAEDPTDDNCICIR